MTATSNFKYRADCFFLVSIVCVLSYALMAGGAVSDTVSAVEILKSSDVKGGLVVAIGCGDPAMIVALKANDSYLVHGLDTDAKIVSNARDHIRSKGLYGKVSIDTFDGKRLPYVDNLVNLVVAEDIGEVPMDEVMRVLSPLGVAMVGGRKVVKPWPNDIDEWTHYLHGADNNAVAKDTVVGPAKRYQWISGPKYARSHDHLNSFSAMVSAKGRVFTIIDEAPVASVAFEPQWRLVARDAFSGVLLWKRSIDSWEGHLRQFRTGPTALAKRLVANGDHVYVTLGYGKPVSILDAATGETIRECEETENAMEIAFYKGTLFIVVGDQAPFETENTGKKAPIGEKHWQIFLEKAPLKHLVAADAETGEMLWKKNDADTLEIMPMAMAVANGRVFFQNERAIFALEAKTGVELWQTERLVCVDRPGHSAPTLVACNDVVICADREPGKASSQKDEQGRSLSWYMYPHADYTPKADTAAGKTIVYDAATGKKLWGVNCVENFRGPADVFVMDNMAFIRSITPGLGVGLDLKTGQRKHVPPKSSIKNPATHWRCYRNKATEKYLLLCQSSTDFHDLATGAMLTQNFIRGACQYGLMPCNGLLYIPQHPCACNITAFLKSFNAVAPNANPTEDIPGAVRFEKGPAYSQLGDKNTPISDSDWPTYRGNGARSGVAKTKVGASLNEIWNTSLKGPLTAPVVAGNLLITACPETHTVHALDAYSGEGKWSYTAGAAVDSPPTIHNNTVLFGCADGWIYCLRATDGQLAWRFRAAPIDRRIVSYDNVESVWPIHGSVLVQDDIVYAVAGRTASMDGMFFCALDARTGRVRVQQRINKDGFSDVLSSDGVNIYMRDMRFVINGKTKPGNIPHLYSSAGFLDDSWWHRTYWQFGDKMGGRYTGWFASGERRNSGRLMVVDKDNIYGFGRRNQYDYMGSHVGMGKMHYVLYAANRSESPKKHPHHIAIDLGDTVMIDGFTYLPRQDRRDGGVIYEYEFFVSQDGNQWGKPVIKSCFSNTNSNTAQQIVRFEKPVKGRYIKLVSKSAIKGHPWAGAAEIGVLGKIVGGQSSVSSDTKATSLAKNRWKILSFSSEARLQRNCLAVYAIDDNPDTYWHTEWATASGQSKLAWDQKKPDLPSRWNTRIELLAWGMVLSDKILFVAGPADLFGTASGDAPHVYDSAPAKSLQAQRDALDGKKGSLLWAVSAETGKKLSEYKLKGMPAWDGLIAANERLYLTMQDGTIKCFSNLN
jgi:outer membrane protein assembly factor BamB/ubiquinone/menaquinone biosynthesis C-methylase UbiE